MRVLRGFLAVATVVSSGCVNFDPDRSQEKFEPLERASSSLGLRKKSKIEKSPLQLMRYLNRILKFSMTFCLMKRLLLKQTRKQRYRLISGICLSLSLLMKP